MVLKNLNILTIVKSLRMSASVSRRIRALALPAPSVAFRFDGDADAYSDALITRCGPGQFRVSLSPLKLERIALYAKHRLPSAIYYLSCCPDAIKSMSIDYSDGDRNSNADFCWSAHDPARGLLPDPHFFDARGFSAIRQLAENQDAQWNSRSDTIRWRGGPNGAGTVTADPAAIYDPEVMQRVRLCMVASAIPEVDVKIVPHGDLADPFKGGGRHLTGTRIEEKSWIADKYAIDVDGHSNSWSNFLIRLHLGCCVFKIGSQFGYRQWYYDRIRPWEHFVPVRADMRDLAEKIDWARSNPDKAKEIARNGQAFARSMTFESETAYAVNAITGHRHAA